MDNPTVQLNINRLLETLRATGKKYDVEKIQHAFEYANALHEGQFRASGEAYISHPIAVAEIAAQMELDTDSICAALLHDIGHGPYSHCFEGFHEVSHEEYTYKIITNKNTEVNKVLSNYDEKLPLNIASIINHTHNNPILYQLISSQIDADRMDYLLRDAYMSGTPYGSFDVNRIMRIMKVKDHNIVYKKSGVSAEIWAGTPLFWRLIMRAGDDVFLQSTGELDEIGTEAADADNQIAVGFGVVKGIDQGFAVDNGDGELLTAAFKIRFGQGFKRRLPFGRIEERFHELQVQNKAAGRQRVVKAQAGI